MLGKRRISAVAVMAIAIACLSLSSARAVDLASLNIYLEDVCQIPDYSTLLRNKRIVSREDGAAPLWSHTLFDPSMRTFRETLEALGAETVPVGAISDASLAEADILFVGALSKPLLNDEIAAAKRFVARGHSIFVMTDSGVETPFTAGLSLTRAFGLDGYSFGPDIDAQIKRVVDYHKSLDTRFGSAWNLPTLKCQGLVETGSNSGWKALIRADFRPFPPCFMAMEYHKCESGGLSPTSGRLAVLSDVNLAEDFHWDRVTSPARKRVDTDFILKGDNMRFLLGVILFLLDRTNDPCTFVERSLGLEPGDLLNLQIPSNPPEDFGQHGITSFDLFALDDPLYSKQGLAPFYVTEPVMEDTKFTMDAFIEKVEDDTSKLSITVLFDGSETMLASDPRELRKCAASVFFQQMPDEKDIATLEFDYPEDPYEHIDVLQTYTADTPALVQSIQGLRSASFDTPVVPAVHEAISFMEANRAEWPGERILIIVADGQKDNDGTVLEAEIERAKALGIVTVVFGPGLAIGPNDALPELRRMAEETGGFYVNIGSALNFDLVFQCLAKLFASPRYRVTVALDPIPPPNSMFTLAIPTNRGKVYHKFTTPGPPPPRVFEESDAYLGGLRVGVFDCSLLNEKTTPLTRYSMPEFFLLLHGYRVSLAAFSEITPESLAQFNVIMTGLHNGTMTPEEQGLIRDWVENGGGLIGFTDRTPYAIDQRPVSSIFGISTVDGDFGSKTVMTGAHGIVSEGPFGNLLEAVGSGYHPISQGAFLVDENQPGLTVYARTEGTNLPAIVGIDGFEGISEFAGNCVFFNDVDFLSHGAIELGMNQSLLLNALTYLTDRLPRVKVEQSFGQADPAFETPVRFEVRFDLPVEGFGDAPFDGGDVKFTGTAAGISYTIQPASIQGDQYDIIVTDVAQDGTLIPLIPGDVARGRYGKGNLPSSSLDNSIVYDAHDPQAIITQRESQPDPADSFPIQFDLTFTEPVTEFEKSDIYFEGTATVREFEVLPQDDGYIVSVLDASNGTVTPTVGFDGFVDHAQRRGSTLLPGTDHQVTFVSPPPVPTITRAPGQAEYANALPIAFRLTWNEPVPGARLTDLVYAGAADQVVADLSGGPLVYDLVVTSARQGKIAFNLPAGRLSDLDGSSNLVALGASAVYDTVPPVVSVSAPSASRTGIDPIDYTVAYIGADTITLSPADVTLVRTGSADGLVSVIGSSADRRTVRVSGIRGTGRLAIALPMGTASDFAGNAATSVPLSESFEVLPPRLRAQPTSLNVGFVELGAFSDRQVTIENLGGDSLRGVASVDAPFTIVSGATYDVKEGATAIVVVRFRPTEAGAFEGTLNFTGGGGAFVPIAAVSGELEGMTEFVSPSTHDFGYVAMGDSARALFRIANVGSKVIAGEVTALAPFRVIGPNGYTVLTGGEAFVEVAFEPQTEGDFAQTLNFSGGAGAQVVVQGKGRPALGRLTVRVRDADSAMPVPCASAIVASSEHVEALSADALGTLETAPLPLGTYDVRVFAPGYTSRTLTVTVGEPIDVGLVPTAGPFVQGSVFAGASITLGAVRVELLQDETALEETVTCADGLFAMPLPGDSEDIALRVSAPGYETALLDLAGYVAGDELAIQLVAVEESTGVFEGMVIDGATTVPLGGARVSARMNGVEHVGRAAANGAYRVTSLRSGQHTVRASHEGYETEEAIADVFAKSAETTYRFELRPIDVTGEGEGEGEGEGPGCAASNAARARPAPVGDIVLWGICALALGWLAGGRRRQRP